MNRIYGDAEKFQQEKDKISMREREYMRVMGQRIRNKLKGVKKQMEKVIVWIIRLE